MKLALAPDLLVTLTGFSANELKPILSSFPREILCDAAALCKQLVNQGLLTHYQAAHATEGRGEGLVVGQYVVLRELGHGSVGMVYQARHRMMGRLSALKVFTPEDSEPETLERFMREIQATSQLDHPHLIKAYEAGEHHGAYYRAMEFVEGINLQDKVEADGPLPLELALDCAIQAAAGLAYAHSLHLVHRDVKPGNIMLGKEGRVRVLDLGLVRFVKGFSSLATSLDGSVRGTAAFMAPEQALSIRNADHRSDIYSLGSSLYFMLTGLPMFLEKAVMLQLVAHQKKPAPSLLATRPELPETLDRVYQKMVAKSPDDRFQNMEQVITSLEAVQTGQTLPLAKETPVEEIVPLPLEETISKDPPSTSAWKRIFPFWRDRSNTR